MIAWIVTSSILIITVLILRAIVRKKISRCMQYALWGLVLIRLLMPFSILDSHISVMNIMPVYTAMELKGFGLTVQTQETDKTVSVQQEENKQVEIADDNSKGAAKSLSGSKIVTSYEDKMTITDILQLIWIIGGVLLGIWFVSANTLLFIKVRKDRKCYVKSGEKLPVYLSENVVSPCLFGVVHPSIYLTYKAIGEGVCTEHVIAHELCHYHHGDHIWSLMRGICLTIWWWNPLVWMAAIVSKKDAEMACDEAAIKNLGETERLGYGRTLVAMIAVKKGKNILYTATTMTSDKKEIKERLNMIIKNPKVVWPAVVGVVLVILVISVCTFTGALDTKESQESITDLGDNTNQLTWYGDQTLISKETKLPEELIENTEEWNSFLESDSIIALVAEIPNQDIYVYGMKENGAEIGTYNLHGICVRQENEIQILDIDWGVYDELPKIQYEDYDNDELKEISMIVRSVNGTDLSFNNLHILKKITTGGFSDYSFSALDWQDMINGKVEYQVQDGILTIAIDGEDTGYRIDLISLEEEWGDKLNSISFGSYGEFTFQDGKIYLEALPTAIVGNWVTPQMITDTGVRMEVLFGGSTFELKNAFRSQADTQAAEDKESAGEEKLPASMKELLEQKLGIALEEKSKIEKAISKISFMTYSDKNEPVYGECTQKRYSFNILMNNLDIDRVVENDEANAWIKANTYSEKAELTLEFSNLTESEAYSDYKALTVKINYYQQDTEKLAGVRITTSPASDTAIQYYHVADDCMLNLPGMLDSYQKKYNSNVLWEEFTKEEANQTLSAMLDDFIRAFCQGDTDKMNQYLMKPESESQNITRKDTEYYLEDFYQDKSDGKISLSYVLYDEDDGNFYLYIDLNYMDGQWKIEEYALEK